MPAHLLVCDDARLLNCSYAHNFIVMVKMNMKVYRIWLCPSDLEQPLNRGKKSLAL